MEFVRDSAEYHFLTFLDRVKDQPSGWIALYFSLSKLIDHKVLISKPEEIGASLKAARAQSETFVAELLDMAKPVKEGFVYMFSDNDVVVLARPRTESEEQHLKHLFSEMGKKVRTNFSDYTDFASQAYHYQKFADKKFFTAQRMQAYEQMADRHKISSIGLRRQRRDYPLVLVVEDDRFTSSYAAGILNKDYEIIQARSGEEGICAYIEHAPDVLFLDIHLPGLNGHQTLESIKTVDRKAFAIMLSVDSVKDNIHKATTYGAHGFLKKPFSKERLIDTVKRSPYIQSVSTTTSNVVESDWLH